MCGPAFFTNTGQKFISVEGINFTHGQGGVVWWGSDGGNHGKHITVRDGWIKYIVNLHGGSNAALVTSRRAGSDVLHGDPEDGIAQMGEYNSVVACSLDYGRDPRVQQGSGLGFNFYAQWYLKLDSNYVGPNLTECGIYYKGLFILPWLDSCSASKPGWQCSNNYIKLGGRMNYAIQQQATIHHMWIYGNVIDCSNLGGGISMLMDDDGSGQHGEELYILSNTIYNPKDGSNNWKCIAWAAYDAIGSDSTTLYQKYNVIYNTDGSSYYPWATKMTQGAYEAMQECDSNLYYDGAATFYYETSGGSGPTGNGVLSWWQSNYGFDNNAVTDDPGFNNAAAGDFSRPSASAEMCVTYGGQTWSVFGAWQPDEPLYSCGDVTGDCAIDIDDIAFLVNYVFEGGPAPNPSESGDVDCSGEIDIDDIVYFVAYIFTGGPELCPTC
ncbi:MAG: hypothetical protein ABIK83_11055 [Candidatus Zixiibacteriota bacterium]